MAYVTCGELGQGLYRKLASIHFYAFALQFLPRNLNLPHKLRMCLGHIVERVNTPAEFEKEVCTERYHAPERELIGTPLAVCQTGASLFEGWVSHTTGTIWSWIFGPKGTSCK